eukprot:SAG31_NODE_3383_length_4335_cov_2.093012_3_plen_235_part_00
MFKQFLHVIRRSRSQINDEIDTFAAAFKTKLVYTSNAREYTQNIQAAHDFASSKLLQLMMDELKLVQRLRSLKRFFLLDQGDFFVHFMDVADSELSKNIADISLAKLRSMLDLSLRSSTADQDPHKDDLSCQILPYTLISQLLRVISVKHDRPGEPAVPVASLSHQGKVTGLEAFTLDYSVQWPLSLVLSRYAITKYQLLFRHLFHCKHLERLLASTWQTHQSTKEYEVPSTST